MPLNHLTSWNLMETFPKQEQQRTVKPKRRLMMPKATQKMNVDSIMYFLNRQKLISLLVVFAISTFAIEAHATNTKLEKVDGKYAVKDIKPTRTNLRLRCSNAKYTLKAQSFNNKMPSFFVKVRFGEDKNVTTVYLSEEISSYLKSSHLIENATYGCLTNSGGLGIHIPSSNNHHSDVFLQISSQGRVFQNFDQTGYTIAKSE